MSNPAQLISNAISNGTLRFDAAGEDEMDSDSDADQYHKSPAQVDDDAAMIEDTTTSSSSASSTTAEDSDKPKDSSQLTPQILESSATPSKLGPGPVSPFAESAPSPGSALSPPSAVMGVQSTSPAAKSESLPKTD